MESNALTVEWVPLDRLFPNPANPRLNDDAVPHVAASLKRFGWQQPLVAKPSGELVAGHTRLKAAQKLLMREAPVVRFTGTDLDATAFAIADNRTHEFATWDEPALAKLLEELRAEDSLDGVGFDPADIDNLLAELDAKIPREVDDEGPELPPANPVARRGDLWSLGDHRLLCGDSTSAEDLARLMAGEKATLYATDPPYCVDYTGNDRPIHDGKASGKDWSHVYREVDIKDLGQFLDGVFAAALPHLAERTPIYVWHAHVQQPTIAAAFERHGLLLHQVCVWVKPCAVFGHSYFRWRHEPVAFGWVQGKKPTHGVPQLDTVWECDWAGKQRVVGNEHPTQKPTRLFEIPMELHTSPGDIVLETFSGSGSQIIAAEMLHRRCRAMEITPAFVDVAIRRWQKASGKDATLDGKSYDAVKAGRGVA
jgi:DNA modification methylase